MRPPWSKRRTAFGVRSPSAYDGPSSPRASGETSSFPPQLGPAEGFRFCRGFPLPGHSRHRATPPPLTDDRLSQRHCHRPVSRLLIARILA